MTKRSNVYITHVLTLLGLIACLLLGTGVHAQDTSKTKKEYVYGASLNAGYHYGFIQGYTFDNSFPDQLFLTDGFAGLKLYNLPFQVEYRFATIRIPYGLNNYFRIRFDADKYLQDLEQKKQQAQKTRKISTDSLMLKRQMALKKFTFNQYKIEELIRLNKDSLHEFIPDSLNINMPTTGLPDSIQVQIPHEPSLTSAQQQKLIDSLNNLVKDYNKSLKALKHVNSILDSIQHLNTTAQLDSLQNLDPYNGLYKGIQKRKKHYLKPHNFEIGTCFPTNSYLMYGTLPINGLFTDFEYKGMYFSLLYGEVINNFLFANTFFERQLLSTQNVTNFFDFSKTNRGRKVAAIKIGKGAFHNNHVHLGFLYGLGLKNYGDTTVVTDVNLQPKESNVVTELTARYNLKQHQFEFALAKSVVANHNSGELFRELSNVSSYSFAGFISYSTAFFKEKTKLKILVKHLQPYYRSFGLGFVNSDYLRLNIKIDQKITKKINVGAFVKNDIDNLYNLVPLTNNILNYGLTAGMRFGRHLNIRGMYNPIVQQITDNTNGINKRFNNYLYNINVSYNKRIKKNNLQSVLTYNYFEINDITGTLNTFQNLTWSNAFIHKKTSITLTSNYFSTNIVDSLDKNNFMNALSINFPIKKIMLKVGAKYFSNLKGFQDFGAMLACTIPVHKWFAIQIEGQKFVVGDYFLSTATNLNKIPYYFSTVLQFKL